MDEPITVDVKDDATISELLINWKNVNTIKKQLVEQEDKIKNKLRIFLKEHQWKNYFDESTNITVEIDSERERVSFDETQLKIILTQAQFQSVRKITKYEVLMIKTAEDKERMKKFLRVKKK